LLLHTIYVFDFGVGELRTTVVVADGLLFKKMINSFLIISKAFSQQPVCGWVVGSGTATTCYMLLACPNHGEAF